jgi:formylglycine-generating enzyme required for sulfatase activity
MAGNVYEWVNDWYSEDYYANSPKANPSGPTGTPTENMYKVLRGGSWSNNALYLRTSSRAFDPDFNNSSDAGFRCAKSISN